jgi:tRNA(fMet)-specific endonuclease VapC
VTHLLDTDIFNHYHAGHPRVVRRAVAIGNPNLAITVVTRIEILQGRFEYVRKAADATQLLKAQRLLHESEGLLATWHIVSLDDAACEEFDRLRIVKSLRQIGRADLLIASIVLANRATLVTRNVRDFSPVPRLRIENWVD